MKKGSVTIKDVAERCGVSPSTVSRVISKSPRISKATTERILACMDELGYYPNAIARSLARNKTGTIGVIMPTTSEEVFLNPFFPEAMRGITKAAAKADYDILLSSNSEKDEELKVIQNFIRSSKVDGIVLMSSKMNDECIEYLCEINFPFSLIGTPHVHAESVNHVDNDNIMAAYELTQHLRDIGKKRIAMIAGDEQLTMTHDRVNGYKRAIDENHLVFNKDLLFTGSFDEETGNKYGKIIAKLDEQPDAVIITDDLVAFGAVRAFEDLGVKIPEDIAIASFTTSVLSRYSSIPLTSVDVNPVSLGYSSVELLVDAIDNNVRGRKIVVPYNIYRRKSTEMLLESRG